MNRTLLVLLACLLALGSKAQHVIQKVGDPSPQWVVGQAPQMGCLSDVMHARLKATFPNSVAREIDLNSAILNVTNGRENDRERGGDLIIPVVVHIVHANGDENISDAQVEQGIADLNAAFSNTDAYQEPDGVTTGIQFCLAQRDPTGLPTTGITRTESTLTVMFGETQDIPLKDLIRWPPTEYLNIWLVREIYSSALGPGVAGYAFFPSSHGEPEDGIVNEARWFGSSTSNSKVHIHEAGHYLGLYHTFEGGCPNSDCQINGDRVCDTPPDASTAPVACPGSVNTCMSDVDDGSTNNPFRPIGVGGTGDVPDQYENYMDYGTQACQHLFSAGQSDRMNAALVTSRASLLDSPGCAPACEATVAHVIAPEDVIVGTSVAFDNSSQCAPLHTFQWWVDGFATSTDSLLGHTFTTVGDHWVRLRVLNSTEQCFSEDSVQVDVSCNADALFTWTPMDADAGEPITFTSGSTTTAPEQWIVNGANAGSGASLGLALAAGAHYVQLVSFGSACADTSQAVFVPIGACVSGEANNWVVGDGEIINFNTGVPVLLDEDASEYFIGFEGMATVSNRFGQLQFYVNGPQVFDREHGIMADSLLTVPSSTQSSLIVPHPGNPDQYFLFTIDDAGMNYDGWLSYSIVDMTLNNGLGGLLEQSELLMAPTSEKMTAIRSCNGDIWVVTMRHTGTAFYCYRITTAGLDTVPVISSTGQQANEWSIGYLRASPQGDKLAAAFRLDYSVWLADFDAITGMVSLPQMIEEQQPYGLEFSPDGSKLYGSRAAELWGFPSDVFQYDLSSDDPATIANSRTVVATVPGYSLGAFQLAPDGRIYIARGQHNLIDRIEDPNALGAACGYVQGAITLERFSQAYGLPNALPRLQDAALPVIAGPTALCMDTTNVIYSIACLPGTSTWNHHGPNSMQVIDGMHVSMDLQMPGTDTLIVWVVSPCVGLVTDTAFIRTGAPLLELGNDTAICSTGQVTLSAGPSHATYVWHDGSTGPFFSTDTAGTFSVTVTDLGGCATTDDVTITTFASALSIDIGPDVEGCSGSYITLHAPLGPYVAYAWSNGSALDSAFVDTYQSPLTLTVTDELGCRASDTLLIHVRDTLIVDLGPDTELCNGNVQLLVAGSGFGLNYLWHDFSNGPTFMANGPGYFWVSVYGCGFDAFDDINLLPADSPIVDLGPDTLVCPAAPVLLSSTGSIGSFVWSDGSSSNSLTADIPGTYWLSILDGDGCFATDTITVSYCTGMEASSDPCCLLVYPNPMSDQAWVVSSMGLIRIVELRDATGRLLRTERVDRLTFEFERGSLSAGTYFLTVRTDQSTATKVIVKD